MPPATLVGGVLGLGVQIYVNAVRKMPLFRNPWEHVLWAGAGAAFGGWLVTFERQTEVELAEMLRKRDDANARLNIKKPA